MYLTIVLLLIFFAIVAMLVREGLWSNTICLFNVITSALLATSLWEPLANWFDRMAPTYTYLSDFMALWTVFIISFAIFRGVTGWISRTRVRFKMPVDPAGGWVVALWVGWVMVSFVTMTLHTAPLARNFLRGDFQPEPDSKMFLGLAPDQTWLAFVHQVSKGSLSTSPPAGIAGEDGANVFDPQGEFIYKYAQRRANFEMQPGLRVQRK